MEEIYPNRIDDHVSFRRTKKKSSKAHENSVSYFSKSAFHNKHHRNHSKRSSQDSYLPPKFVSSDNEGVEEILRENSVLDSSHRRKKIISTPRGKDPSNLAKALKTPVFSRSANKSGNCSKGSQQNSSKRSKPKQKRMLYEEYQTFGNTEGNDKVAEEDDPTAGWIKINNKRMRNVPNEEQKYDTFWNNKNKKYIPSDSSVKHSVFSSQNNEKMSQRRAHSKLKNALALSRKRIEHFNEHKSSSPVKTTRDVKASYTDVDEQYYNVSTRFPKARTPSKTLFTTHSQSTLPHSRIGNQKGRPPKQLFGPKAVRREQPVSMEDASDRFLSEYHSIVTTNKRDLQELISYKRDVKLVLAEHRVSVQDTLKDISKIQDKNKKLQRKAQKQNEQNSKLSGEIEELREISRLLKQRVNERNQQYRKEKVELKNHVAFLKDSILELQTEIGGYRQENQDTKAEVKIRKEELENCLVDAEEIISTLKRKIRHANNRQKKRANRTKYLNTKFNNAVREDDYRTLHNHSYRVDNPKTSKRYQTNSRSKKYL
ncbi:unnamed protein product [Moneuplotes crassus]|uniref:Lebercilin domain-containing protein n=1 Tax=Euplotes crassus TaxID=5936 RepID=A0AAD1U4R4_EUPCR|nr:unnamed protein product [Moneuplotes crassus]